MIDRREPSQAEPTLVCEYLNHTNALTVDASPFKTPSINEILPHPPNVENPEMDSDGSYRTKAI